VDTTHICGAHRGARPGHRKSEEQASARHTYTRVDMNVEDDEQDEGEMAGDGATPVPRFTYFGPTPAGGIIIINSRKPS
jgi:hypothetical protein